MSFLILHPCRNNQITKTKTWSNTFNSNFYCCIAVSVFDTRRGCGKKAKANPNTPDQWLNLLRRLALILHVFTFSLLWVGQSCVFCSLLICSFVRSFVCLCRSLFVCLVLFFLFDSSMLVSISMLCMIQPWSVVVQPFSAPLRQPFRVCEAECV